MTDLPLLDLSSNDTPLNVPGPITICASRSRELKPVLLGRFPKQSFPTSISMSWQLDRETTGRIISGLKAAFLKAMAKAKSPLPTQDPSSCWSLDPTWFDSLSTLGLEVTEVNTSFDKLVESSGF